MDEKLSNLRIFLQSKNLSEARAVDLIVKESSLDELKSLLKEVGDPSDIFSSGQSFMSSMDKLRDLVKGRNSAGTEHLSDIIDEDSGLTKLRRLVEDTFKPEDEQVAVQTSGQEEVSSYRPSTDRVSAQGLYSDLMAGIGNKNLCIAMVANAIGESNLYVNSNGDCGDYAKNRGIDTSKYPQVFRRPSRGRCCSFGLRQYNICGGLGISLLEEYGASKESSDIKKYEIITDYRKQLDFMIKHVQRKFNINENKSVDEWVKLFVYKVERPADKPGATARRQEIARGLAFA